MTTILAIDTASPRFALALAIDGEVATAYEHDGEQEHSQQLLAQVDALLGEHRQDLAGVVVVRGPGSYAGLRVGIATTEGIALSLDLPIVGVGTLDAVAHAVGGELLAIHPAGRGEFAAQRFVDGVPNGEMFAAKPAELAGERLAGEGAGELGGREVSPGERVRAALQLGLERMAEASGAVEAIYLREPNISRPRPRPASEG